MNETLRNVVWTAAVALLLAACTDAQVRGPATSAVDSLIAGGEISYREGDHARARAQWMEALQRVDAADDRAEPRILTWLALLCWREGDYAEARALGQRGLDLKLERGLSDDLFSSYNALGLIAWHEGRLTDAADLFERALAAADTVTEPSAKVRVESNLGNVKTDLGEFAEAAMLFASAREGVRRLGDERVEAAILTNLAMLDIRVGDAATAIGPLLAARRLFRNGGFAAEEVNAMGQLGTAYVAIGEPQLAFLAFDSALAQARALGMRQEEASNLEWLAVLYHQMGDVQRALQHYARARSLNMELGLAMEAGTVQRSQAEVLAALGHFANAQASALGALELHRDSGARLELLFDHLLLAEIASHEQAGAAVDAHLEEARTLAGQLDVRSARTALALAEARIADRAGDPRTVLAVLDAARTDVEDPAIGTAWESYALRARALMQLDRIQEAVEAGRTAVSAVERVRGRVDAPNLRTTFTAERSAVYGDLVIALLRLGRPDEAFAVADAARGRALLEHLASARSTVRKGTVAGDLVDGEDLLRQIDALALVLAGIREVSPRYRTTGETTLESELQQRLVDLRSQYESHLVRVVSMDPAGAALLGVRQASSDEVQAALRPDEALIQYMVLPDRLVAFVITTDGMRTISTEIPSYELRSRVRLARHLLGGAQTDTAESFAVSSALHELLVTPLLRGEALESRSHLMIVPDPMLAYLPFAALRDPRHGRPLSQVYVLSHLPSAAALPALRTGRRIATSSGAAVFAPFPDRLPGTLKEAEEFQRVMGGGGLRRGRHADEAELRKALATRGTVHVATHALLNARNPMFSRIELARGSGGSEDDGRLEVHEVLATSVRSQLVFLSGCETALGGAGSTYHMRGEDYATLAQAFLYAGAGSVIATLWRIEDEGAAAFAARFYHHLRGQSASAALAAAQRDLQRDARFHRPYYWAGYVLSGDGANESGAIRGGPAVQ